MQACLRSCLDHMYKSIVILFFVVVMLAHTGSGSVNDADAIDAPSATDHVSARSQASHSVLTVVSYVWLLFKTWILIFISPIYPRFEPDILWIIIPIWLNFVVTEIYQEKHGTNFGNAIQNGLVAALIGVDWMRYLTRTVTKSHAVWSHDTTLKYTVSILVFAYGCVVVYHGI